MTLSSSVGPLLLRLRPSCKIRPILPKRLMEHQNIDNDLGWRTVGVDGEMGGGELK